MNRKQMLKLLKGLDSPQILDSDNWMDCLEIEVATDEGVGMASIQDGSTGPTGPVRIDKPTHLKINAAMKTGREAVEALAEEADSAGNIDEFLDALAMVSIGCKPDTDYFKLVQPPYTDQALELDDILDGDDIETSLHYSTDKEELEAIWIDDVAQSVTEFDSWDDMDDEQLQGWIEGLSLSPKARQPSKAKKKNGGTQD